MSQKYKETDLIEKNTNKTIIKSLEINTLMTPFQLKTRMKSLINEATDLMIHCTSVCC